MIRDFDLVVIGSGPAGEKGATQAAYLGKKVAVVEKAGVLGGASVNTGTLPSKTLRETALYLSGFRQRGLFGVESTLKREATIQDLLYRERIVKSHEQRRVDANLRRFGVEVVHGVAGFEDAHTLLVKGANGREERLTAKVFLVATGSSPHRPPMYPFEDDRVHDSDELLDLKALPDSMVVVGGGVIGCEYACMFAALGIPTTLVDQKDRLLPFLDGEMSARLAEKMQEVGVTLDMPDSVEGCDATGPRVALTLKSGKRFSVGGVLVAAGRTGNTAGLNLDKLGVQLEPRGRIVVNEHCQTAVPHIYAAGDVIGFPALASTSMEQGRIAMVHAFDLRAQDRLPAILPYGVYTIPEVSMAGETEESLQQAGIDYVVGRAEFIENARGEIIGESRGALKLLFRTSDMRLLGVHAIGEQASELIHVGLVALLTFQTADLFIQTCFNYPTLSDSYKEATLDALARRHGRRIESIVR